MPPRNRELSPEQLAAQMREADRVRAEARAAAWEQAKELARYLRTDFLPGIGCQLRRGRDGCGNRVYLHREPEGTRASSARSYYETGGVIAEIVYEGRRDWAYEVQEAFAEETAEGFALESRFPNLQLEVGINGYCLLLEVVV